ncbi:MAG: DUF4394 domain-containing protein, partial [Rhodopirellula sp.]|nr:DUF4394 domain-containing protein [Rhodopirellula sp.]
FRTTAAYIGSGSALNVTNLAIFPNATEHPFVPADNDFFRFVAQQTGTLDFQVYFQQFSSELLPAGGNLTIAVYDAQGDFIADSSPALDDDERVRIPVVAGQTYYLRVYGETTNLLQNTAVNGYDMTIVNTAPPVPYDLEVRDIIAMSTIDSAVNTATTFSGSPAPLYANQPQQALSTLNDFYNGKYIYFLSGPNAGLRAEIVDYVGATQSFVVTAGTLAAAPTLGDSFLVESYDTGRSQLDDITRDETPLIYLRLDDGIFLHDLPGNPVNDTPPDRVIPIPFVSDQTRDAVDVLATLEEPGYRIAIFDEGTPQQPNALPQVPIGFARMVAEGVYVFDFGSDAINPADPNGPTIAFPLTDGSHFLSAKVQILDPNINLDTDAVAPGIQSPTGFGARSVSMELVVDTIIPPVSFGNPNVEDDGLAPDSDTGVSPPNPDTIDDRVTNDVTPTFWGRAEADAVVRLYADRNGDGILQIGTDVFIGQATAIPIDGTNQFPNGYWEIESIVNLNREDLFPYDGLRTIFVTAEDVAGNVNDDDAAADVLEIFLDTQGPVIEGVFICDSDMVALGAGNTLLRFNSGTPDFINATLPITGLNVGDVVVGIDVRPSNGLLYAVVNGVAPNADRVITINPETGVITSSQNLSVPQVLSGASFGVDFNPVADRLRIVSDTDQNLRVNVDTGLVTVDPALNPGNPNVVAAAYTNILTTGTTTLYTIDTATDNLNIQFPANAGTQVVVGALGVNATNVAGFDIADGTNIAFASLTVGGTTSLYRIDLATGAATAVDTIGSGATAVGGLTALPAFDLFNPKPTEGPTPLVWCLKIPVTDLPTRLPPDFLYDALKQEVAEDPGRYLLVGDNVGPIAIKDVVVTQFIGSDNVAHANIELFFFEPLPDDRYSLTVAGLVDPVGNEQDGESDAVQPLETPGFPTGDGVPGGDFLARFTVDSRPEIAVWAAGSIYADINQNWIFDPDVQHQFPDDTNRDLVFKMGFTSDNIFAGQFTGPGPDGVFNTADDRAGAAGDALADGFDRIGAYGRVNGAFRWLVDIDNDGVADLPLGLTTIDEQGVIGPGMVDPNASFGLPVAGNFDGFKQNGDEVGVFNGTTWWLDTNHDYVVDTAITSPLNGGHPIVGDFDGDGKDDLATWADDQFWFDLADDVNPNNGYGFYSQGNRDAMINFGFIGIRERPAAADIDQDGIDDLALYVPDQTGVAPSETAEWFILMSNDLPGGVLKRQTGTVVTLDHAFSPDPLGQDLFAQFGDDYAKPILGNFDPPVAEAAEAIVPSTGDLAGTDGDDTVKIQPGTGEFAWVVTVNGTDYGVAGDNVTINFDGLGGNDTVTFVGGTGADQAVLRPTSAVFDGAGYSIAVVNVESIDYDGADGDDKVTLFGSGGENVYDASPGQGAMSGDGVDLNVKAETIYARGNGGSDIVYFSDSEGDDLLEYYPRWATMSGEGYFNQVNAFKVMFADAERGGADKVIFRGTSANDQLRVTEKSARFLSGTGAVWHTARGFDSIVAYG